MALAFLHRMPVLRPPGRLMTEAFVRLFNHGMRGQRACERLAELSGKRVRICVTEPPLVFDVTVGSDGLLKAAWNESMDVIIRGSLADFRALATRAEDPDTLFFERRLCVEGDTETGLAIKNALDALEWDWQTHVQAALIEPLTTCAAGAGRRIREVLRPG